MKKIIPLIITFTVCLSLWSTGVKESEDSGKPTIYVSILPQAYLLERIGGSLINVNVMVPPGKSPSTYEPTPQQVVGLGAAKLFFILNVPFEQSFLPTIKKNMKDLPIIDASLGITKRNLHSHKHDEDEAEEHEEKEILDPHIWLSPVLAKEIAVNMTEALINLDPENAPLYEKNLNELRQDLTTLDQDLEKSLSPYRGSTLFVFHPSFGYFADRYGLIQESIELGGKEPSPADLERVIDKAKEEGVKIILVQPEFSQSSAKAVASAIGGKVIPVETLSGDYINNLRELATSIQRGLE